MPATPRFGRVNWIGFWTLYKREVRRFIKVYLQTVGAPVVMAMLFLAVFSLALGRDMEMVEGVPFLAFLAPGLMMMSIIQNAFTNTASSIMIAKVQGNIVDVLMPPLSPGELTLAFALGGVTRGLIVGLAVALVMALVAPVTVRDAGLVLYHAASASLLLSLMGAVAGIWADKFDHMAAITNFVITPLSFLSGTFYSINRLEGVFHDLAYLNPFFYHIDGFRTGFIGHADADPALGIAITIATNAVLFAVTYWLFRRGWKLKT